MRTFAVVILVVLLVKLGEAEHEESHSLVQCRDSADQLACGDHRKCVQRTQICDGVMDCSEGEDENPAMCANRPCVQGVRCEESNICLSVPHRSLCSGGKPSCPDKSDQSYCLGRIFTGCFANSTLGLKITNCKSCFCELWNKSSNGQREAMFYKSGESTTSKTHVHGRVCMERSSNLFCDGIDDCLFGEDEDPELCYKDTDSGTAQNKGGDSVNIKLDSFDVGSYADSGGEFAEKTSVDLKMILMIFFLSCVSVVSICLIIIIVMFKLVKSNRKPPQQVPYKTSFNRQTSSGSSNEYVPTPKPPDVKKKPEWTLKTTSIVKELGKGFYSKVYLAQDASCGFVALKTVDNKRSSNSEECISNEIDILSNIGTHLNLVKLVGFNRDEKLVVMEYCFNGNLKDYISRYRDYYMDEINPETRELCEESFLYKSPTGSENIPMSDFLTSMHANVESDVGEEKIKNKEVPVITHSKSLIKTRRILYWSYQISKGMKYLSDLGIIHRDIALRNMLLTNNDVVKIADFGLAVTVFSTSSDTKSGAMPQYWSKSNKPQPYKWMAVESLVTHVYSQSSDVWAFGIAVWELFTLGGEPYGEINPTDLSQALIRGSRLEECSLAPSKVNTLLKDCWLSDPARRPSFENVVLILSSYMSKMDRHSYVNRSRLDSGIVEGEKYVEINLNIRRESIPSTGTTSKSSTRSRTISKCSELSYLPSSSSSQVPSPKAQSALYLANYKLVNGVQMQQVKSSLDQENDQITSNYAVPQLFNITGGGFDQMDLNLTENWH